jgi:hypothetical protein
MMKLLVLFLLVLAITVSSSFASDFPDCTKSEEFNQLGRQYGLSYTGEGKTSEEQGTDHIAAFEAGVEEFLPGTTADMASDFENYPWACMTAFIAGMTNEEEN